MSFSLSRPLESHPAAEEEKGSETPVKEVNREKLFCAQVEGVSCLLRELAKTSFCVELNK